MTLESLSVQTRDVDFRMRVGAAANKIIQSDPEMADTDLGKAINTGVIAGYRYFIWPVSHETEAAYATAYEAGKNKPPNIPIGRDPAIISDATIEQSVRDHWPIEGVPEPFSGDAV